MITDVTVYLDNSRLECMEDYFRCDHVVAALDDGREEIRNDLMDSSGYFSRDDLISDIIGLTGVRREDVMLVE